MESLLLGLIDTIDEAALNPDAWPASWERVADSVSGTTGTSLQITHASARRRSNCLDQVSVLSQVHRDTAWGLAYERHYHAVNAFAEKRFLLRPVKVLTTSAMLADADRAKTECYNDFLKPQDCFYGLAGLVLKRVNRHDACRHQEPRKVLAGIDDAWRLRRDTSRSVASYHRGTWR